MILNERERANAVAEVAELIRSSGVVASVHRILPETRLFGSDEASFAPIGTIQLSLDEMPQDAIREAIDAVASVLPDAEVLAEDRIIVAGVTYRVQSRKLHVLFGVHTHAILHLVKLHGRATNG